MRYYVGIDMAARSSHVCVMDDQQRVYVDQKVSNDFHLIWDILEPFVQGLSVVVEASFNWYWLVDSFIECEIPIKLAHPAHIKAITSAKIKTDRRDARWLAELLRCDLIPESHICPLELRRLRDLCRFRARLAERHGNSLRQLRQTITNEGYHSVSKTVLADLDIERLDVDPFVKQVCYVQQDIQAAHDQAIKKLDQHIVDGLKQFPLIHEQVMRLRDIAGFGPVNSATVVFESGNLHRFKSHKPYMSYARLTPGIAQSGEKSQQGRGRKVGNEHLKRAYSCAAMHAGRFSDAIQSFRDKHRQRRSSHQACHLIVNSIVAHKLATGVFYMLTRNEPFQEDRLFPS